MKKILSLLMILTFMIIRTDVIEAKVIKTNQRQVLSYEILDTHFSQDTLIIEGWALLPTQQHFINEKTHAYELILRDEAENELHFPSQLEPIDLSEIMHYRGYPFCQANQVKNSACNYLFKNVGFKTTIDLNTLNSDQTYTFFIQVSGKTVQETYESPLYYPKDHIITHENKGKRYEMSSHYHKMGLEQFYHTLVVRKKPEPFTTTVEIGENCSAAHENKAFFKQNTYFNNILGIKKYRGLITYFKVPLKDGGCHNGRRRVVEGDDPHLFGYVPSTYVNYYGDPFRLTIETISSTPIIIAKDQTIQQYSEFDPYFDTQVTDKLDQNVKQNLKVKHNINTRIPGKYEACYHVKNHFGNQARKCINVQVVPIKTKIRYIHPISLQHLFNRSKLWSHMIYQNELINALR